MKNNRSSREPGSAAPDEAIDADRRERTHVIVADDHPVVAHGIARVLDGRPHIRLVTAVTSIVELLEALRRQPCDVLVCDYSFEGDSEPDGLQLLERIRRLHPHVKIILLTAHDNLAVVQRVMSLRVAGFLSKSSSDFTDLPGVIERVMDGERYLDPRTSKMVISHMIDNGTSAHTLASIQLTTREMEVVRLFASGMSVTDIAQHTSRSLKTISTQKKKAMVKLGASNDVELVNAFRQLF